MVDISVISLLLSIVSICISAILVYITWRRDKKENPNIVLSVITRSYKIEDLSKLEFSSLGKIRIKMKLRFENKGRSPCSITDIKIYVRYAERLFDESPQLKHGIRTFIFSERPLNYTDLFPIEIKSYGSEKIEVEFLFDGLHINYLDRFLMLTPISFQESKKWDWKDLPLMVKIVAKTPLETIDTLDAVYRDNLPESKRVNGTIKEILDSNPKDFFPIFE
jgi:hypothetical protein